MTRCRHKPALSFRVPTAAIWILFVKGFDRIDCTFGALYGFCSLGLAFFARDRIQNNPRHCRYGSRDRFKFSESCCVQRALTPWLYLLLSVQHAAAPSGSAFWTLSNFSDEDRRGSLTFALGRRFGANSRCYHGECR